MEPQLIVQALRATGSPGNQKEATAYLANCSAITGFPLVLMDIVRDNRHEIAIRQAAAIFLKNLTGKAWVVKDLLKGKVTQINEQDKIGVRSQIVDAIIDSPEAIGVQLCTCIHSILRNDFPDNWVTQRGETIVAEIVQLLTSNQGAKYFAGLRITYRLAKIFEYSRQEKKKPFTLAMQQILPVLYQLSVKLSQANIEESRFLQKLILKIFYCLVEFSLSPELFTNESFHGWFNIFIRIIDQDAPAEISNYGDEKKEESVYWKCKKWAMKIVDHIFVSYGSKGRVEKNYEQFEKFYTHNLAPTAISSVMRILSQQASNGFVSKRVLHLAINYLSEALSHSEVWKSVKDHFMPIFTNVIFPLMKYSDYDQELWEDEPAIYLQGKLDHWEENNSPTSAAIKFINAASKRKGILQPIITFAVEKLQSAETNSRDICGALNVVDSLIEVLCSDKRYKKDVMKLLNSYVSRYITSQDKFVRAQALQVVTNAASAPSNDKSFLLSLTNSVLQRLEDPNEELPVKFEAAMAIQSLIEHQAETHVTVRLHVESIFKEVMHLILELKLDDLPGVIESVVENFSDAIIPIARSVVNEMTRTFLDLISHDEFVIDGNESVAWTILLTLQTIVEFIDDRPDIIGLVEPTIRGIISCVFKSSQKDYYDECIGLLDQLTSKKIEPKMWGIYDQMCNIFEAEKSAFFHDAMPCFYNFIVTDTNAFLSNPDRVNKMLNMCGQVIASQDDGDEIRTGAVKIIEVMITKCRDRLDNYFTEIVKLLMQYLVQPQEDFEEFETQLIVTLAAAFVCNPQQFIPSINSTSNYGNNFYWLFEKMFEKYKDFDGIHNRIVILNACIMAFRMPSGERPPRLTNPQKTMEFFMDLFEQIRRCRIAIAKENELTSDSSSDDDMGRDIDLDLNDSDDDLGENHHDSRFDSTQLDDESSIDSEDRHSFIEQTDLEYYETDLDRNDSPVNVYDQFLNLLEELERSEPHYYHGFVHSMPENKKKEFEDLIGLCRREQMHFQSRKIAQSGGYEFDISTDVPNSFNFS